ncbi:MAG: NAD(P)H-dependent flavin oxidoreductase [Lautropia sp.]
MAKADLRDVLGIELPIIQAPMAGVQDAALAIAVSNAGGLGSLPCAMLGPEAIEAELARIRAETDRPVNVNFFCHVPPAPDDAAQARWLAALAPYHAAFGIDPRTIGAGVQRAPYDARAAAVLARFRPRVVSFHFGLPSPELIRATRDWGARILASATTVEEAVWLEANGADIVVAQGLEAGGHRGQFLSPDLDLQAGTFALLPQVVQAVRLPVVAAGGIASPEAVAAAMSLGAAGVQIGTSYLLCPEATTSALHRAALVSPQARHTALTNVFSGRPARGIVNRVMRELGPMSAAAPPFPLASAALGPLRAAAEKLGRTDFSPLWSGQNATGCRQVPAADLTRSLARLVARGPAAAGGAVPGGFLS